MRGVPSTLEAALLGLLARGPASGYELRKVFQTTPLGAYSDSPGAVYPALRRLQLRGLIASLPAVGGRGRTPWQLTAAGRTWVRGWVARPVTAFELSQDPALVDLRLAMLGHITPGRLRSFLQEYSAAIETYHATVRRAARVLRGELRPSAALALDLGLHLLRARETWCKRSLRNLPR